jgi:hypothetical protein
MRERKKEGGQELEEPETLPTATDQEDVGPPPPLPNRPSTIQSPKVCPPHPPKAPIKRVPKRTSHPKAPTTRTTDVVPAVDIVSVERMDIPQTTTEEMAPKEKKHAMWQYFEERGLYCYCLKCEEEKRKEVKRYSMKGWLFEKHQESSSEGTWN